jgi:transcriptional regulator with XRE-family HTH domain
MIIGDRVRELREEKKLSQGDVERRCGLMRCYISRVENGHTVPALETLEKMAHALEVPMYQLFYEGEAPPAVPKQTESIAKRDWASRGKGRRFLARLQRCLGRMDSRERGLLLCMVKKMAASPTLRRDSKGGKDNRRSGILRSSLASNFPIDPGGQDK